MSIKNLKPSGNSGFIQGYYNPINPDKYIGPTPIIYRSSWERKFCIMCDNRDDVIKWSSEPVEIKYMWSFDKREHRYYPDFYMKTRGLEGEEEFLVEIKPTQKLWALQDIDRGDWVVLDFISYEKTDVMPLGSSAELAQQHYIE